VTLSDLAALCVVSDRTIQRLTKQGVLRLAKDRKTRGPLAGRYELGEMARFVEHLRDSIANDSPSEAAYAGARARRMTALAEAEQLRLQATRGELVRRDSVSLTLTSLLSATKNHAPSASAPYAN
jgi:hypothetical protein